MTRLSLMVRAVGASLLVAGGVGAQVPAVSSGTAEPAERADTTESPVDAVHGDLNAYEAVHQGNQRLNEGDPSAALALYNHAEAHAPDAREIAFARGLSYYALDEFDAARQAFQAASLGSDDALSNDAIYSEGTTYHAEAIAATDDPRIALSKLENAMRRYQIVLADRPEHAAARDANFKAASVWRQLMQQVEEQPKDCDNPSDEESDDSQDKEQQEQQSSDGEQQQDPSDKSEPEESQEQDQESQDQQQASADEQQEQEASAAEQQEEQASKEQAERKLREMVQAQRQLSKDRRQRVRLIPVKPVDKDW